LALVWAQEVAIVVGIAIVMGALCVVVAVAGRRQDE